MIWLSPASGTKECSIYFDIRDIDLQFSEGRSTCVVRGLLGDGSNELWGEVSLGQEEFAKILPLWTEIGGIESFSDAVDEDLLQQEMLFSVKDLLHEIGSTIDTNPFFERLNPKLSSHYPTQNLAA